MIETFADKHLTVCPLGLCTFEEVCPNAPCMACMRTLGQHLIAEMGIMLKQADAAKAKGNEQAHVDLRVLAHDVGSIITNRTAKLYQRA